MGVAAQTGLRRDVDDVAAAFDKRGHRGATQVERAGEVHADHAVPECVVDLVDRAHHRNARDVTEHVEASESLDRHGDGVFARRRVRDVTAVSLGIVTGVCELRRDLVDALRVDVETDDPCSLRRQEPHGLAPDARAGSRHQGDLVSEPSAQFATPDRVEVLAGERDGGSERNSPTSRKPRHAMQTVVISGANAGLGFQTALRFARAGARIVMACRNMEKARVAQGNLQTQVPYAQSILIPLDVSEPASIREFGRQFSDQIGQLDILLNNAGMIAMPLARNSVGHELQLATNYLGAFALTGTLLPFFRTDAPARIVNVG